MKIKHDNIADSLREADATGYPNMNTAFTLLANLPITSCECERSASTLRRLKTWLRSTMTEGRLNGLALMHINRDIEIDCDSIINAFAEEHSRRMKFVDLTNED
jgi:hypothetical protein